MSRTEAWFHHSSNLLVGGTGLIYAWILFFATSDDEFSVWNHPWQGIAHDLHLVLAPLLALSFGIIWVAHASKRLRQKQKRGRATGMALCISFLPMLFSAYFLQVAVDEEWRSIWKWIHLATSLLWVAGYVMHQLRRKRERKTA
ncbi:MAG: hypothetical protein O3A95_04485 [Planctomycetota bacterium]|nr:hypothetical protein [Planctomycetota bacterium]MDA1113542.1 hypothetical protein [Planctomycetota bacterium]